jgi:hypothetical protein
MPQGIDDFTIVLPDFTDMAACELSEISPTPQKSPWRKLCAAECRSRSDLLEPRFWSFRFANPPPERGDHFGESLPRRSPTEPESVSIYAVISTRLPSVSLTTAS